MLGTTQRVERPLAVQWMHLSALLRHLQVSRTTSTYIGDIHPCGTSLIIHRPSCRFLVSRLARQLIRLIGSINLLLRIRMTRLIKRCVSPVSAFKGSGTIDTRLTYGLDDPLLFANQPSTVQIVCRPFDDEELIEISAMIDNELHSQTEAFSK
jgi:hypothetical protein